MSNDYSLIKYDNICKEAICKIIVSEEHYIEHPCSY